MKAAAIWTAALLGVLFPVLETLRRGLAGWLERPASMAEDYVAGLLLLGAAWLAGSSRPSGSLAMLGAGAYVTGMMSSSFWGEIEQVALGLDPEPNQAVVVVVKALLWAACLFVALAGWRGLEGSR